MAKHLTGESRGALRTLTVLRALNKHNGATITELHAATHISRPALYRILAALGMAGYVARTTEGAKYLLTSLVRTLSDGYRDDHWICEVATPVMHELQKTILWPTDLATLHNYEMHLRDTTRRRSPFVIDQGAVGARLSMLQTASGLAYLAHCGDDERKTILNVLRRPGNPDYAFACQPSRVSRLLQEVRAKGYGWRYKHKYRTQGSARTGSIAVPIYFDRRVVATVGMTFIARALTVNDAAIRHLNNLKTAAREIERRLKAPPSAASTARRSTNFDSRPASR